MFFKKMNLKNIRSIRAFTETIEINMLIQILDIAIFPKSWIDAFQTLK